jgi:hypothetical protein
MASGAKALCVQAHRTFPPVLYAEGADEGIKADTEGLTDSFTTGTTPRTTQTSNDKKHRCCASFEAASYSLCMLLKSAADPATATAHTHTPARAAMALQPLYTYIWLYVPESLSPKASL